MLDPCTRQHRLRSLALVLAVTWTLGCDPYSDVRAELDPAARARFARGQRAATPCWTCHDITGTSSKVGPGLQDLMGRQAGTTPGFPHSQAMRDSGVRWNARSLDAFLTDAQRVVPGSKMVAPGISDPRQRADLIFFLELATASRGG
jgi:cytochrome c